MTTKFEKGIDHIVRVRWKQTRLGSAGCFQRHPIDQIHMFGNTEEVLQEILHFPDIRLWRLAYEIKSAILRTEQQLQIEKNVERYIMICCRERRFADLCSLFVHHSFLFSTLPAGELLGKFSFCFC